MKVDISVVIATHNQKERLSLVLAGLTEQTFEKERYEIVVVDDGSTDGTDETLQDIDDGTLPLRVVQLSANQGRCIARNIGVKKAKGKMIGFLDGDALPHPQWLQAHWDACQKFGFNCLSCGFEYCLPELEYLKDPRIGSVMERVTPSVMREYLRIHSPKIILTEERIKDDFDSVHRSASEGGYPFPELKQVQDQTMELFSTYPDSSLSWIGFYPHNGMLPRKAFLQAGGFDPEIPFSEGWELAYRLRQQGVQPCFTQKAKTYHLYHYHGFSDPTIIVDEKVTRLLAVEYMASKLNNKEILRIPFWQAAIWPDPFIPEEMKVNSLVDLHYRYQTVIDQELRDLQAILERYPMKNIVENPHVFQTVMTSANIEIIEGRCSYFRPPGSSSILR